MSNQQSRDIEKFISDLKRAPDSKSLTGTQLLDKIKASGIITDASYLQELEDINQKGIVANDAFKNATLSNLVYSPYDAAISFINDNKREGKEITFKSLVESGTLNENMTPMDLASLNYYLNTFTPVSLLQNGDFNNVTRDTDKYLSGAKKVLSFSEFRYENGVFRADNNLAMAMTVMSQSHTGNQEVNVAIRGTDSSSKGVIEGLGKKNNGMARYVALTYLDMEKHFTTRFEPVLNAVTDAVRSFNVENKNQPELNVVVTGHSLGGGLAEEFAKVNSRKFFYIKERNENNASDYNYSGSILKDIAKEVKGGLIHFNKDHKQYVDQVCQEELNAPLPSGKVSLKAISFGAPSNNRISWGLKTTNAMRAIFDYSSYDSIMNDAHSDLRRGLNKQLVKSLVGGVNISKNITLLGSDLASSVLETFAKSSYVGIAEQKVKKERDYQILSRDLTSYSKPKDPVSNIITAVGFSKKAPNLNVMDAIAQKDFIFNNATKSFKSHQEDEDVKNKGVISKSWYKMTKMVKSCFQLGASLLGVEMSHHSINKYSASIFLKNSPLRDPNVLSISKSSPEELLKFIVDCKSKKDIFAMEVIVKEFDIESKIRQSLQNNEAINMKDFRPDYNFDSCSNPKDINSFVMTAKFTVIEDMIGGIVSFNSQNNSTNKVAVQLEKIAQESFIKNGLPDGVTVFNGLKDNKAKAIELMEANRECSYSSSNFYTPPTTCEVRVLDKETGMLVPWNKSKNTQKGRELLEKVVDPIPAFNIPGSVLNKGASSNFTDKYLNIKVVNFKMPVTEYKGLAKTEPAAGNISIDINCIKSEKKTDVSSTLNNFKYN